MALEKTVSESVRTNEILPVVSKFRGTHTGQQELVQEQIKNKKIKNKKEGEAEKYLQTYRRPEK